MAQEKEYFAFISYQRKDEEWADRLRSKLEHYRLPSSVRRQDASLPKEIRPIFRDALELAGGVLAKEIEAALQQSKFLIVICSPNSAKSPWVNKEIQTFIDLGREDRIIPFIIDGTPFSDNEETECFPPALRSLKDERELLGININEMGRDAAAVKVVARMFGLKFDALWQRYEREKRKKMYGIVVGTIAAFLCISGIALWMYQQKKETQQANWMMMENHARMVAEKSKDEVKKGNTYDAILALLELLPQDGSRPFVAELDGALRTAYDSLQNRRWNCKNLGQNFNRLSFSRDGERILGMSDASIVVFDARTLNSISEIKLSDDMSGAMSFLSPTNDTLFVIGTQHIMCYSIPDGQLVGQLTYTKELLTRCMDNCYRWVTYAEDSWIDEWKKAVGLHPEVKITNYNPVRQQVLIENEKETEDSDTQYSYSLYDCKKQQIIKTIENYNGTPFSIWEGTGISSTSFSPDGHKLAFAQLLGTGFVLNLDDGSTSLFDCGNPDCAHYSNWLSYGCNGQLLHSSDFANVMLFDCSTLTPIDSLPANHYSADLNRAGDICLLGSDVYFRNTPNDTTTPPTCDFRNLGVFDNRGFIIDTIVNQRHHIICSGAKLQYTDILGEYDSWEQSETNEFITKSIIGFLHDNRYVLIVREGIRGSLYGIDIIDIASGVQVYHIDDFVDQVYYDTKTEKMAFGHGNDFFPETAIYFPTLEHLIDRCKKITEGMTLSAETRKRLYLNRQKE